MKKHPCWAGLMLALCCAVAQAGPASEDLQQCMSQSISSQDQKNLMLWLHTVISSHPYLKAHAQYSKAEVAQVDDDILRLFTRLVYVDCAESLQRASAEGRESTARAFEALGMQAMQELMRHPDVEKANVRFLEALRKAESH